MFDQNYMYNGMKWKLLYLLLLTASACNNSPSIHGGLKDHHQLASAGWLVGLWVYESPKGNIYESWKKLNDSLLVGRSYSIVGNDTITGEEISMVELNGEVNYIPTVKDQNEGLPVKFKLTSISEGILVFENPAHDFPQRISYQSIAADSLVAEVSGPMNGTQKSQRFPMHRAQ